MAYSPRQSMLYLALTADGGDQSRWNAAKDEHYIQKLITEVYLPRLNQDQPADWQLVWGPAVFALPTLLGKPTIDNVAIVVRNGTTDEYAIALSGTDPISLSDWLLEDLDVISKVPWSWGTPTSDPQISKAISYGLTQLQALVPVAGIAGAGQSMVGFLQTITTGNPVALQVTGHSLGGALCEVMGLYLRDTQGLEGGWDPRSLAAISVYSYAGPTPGDGAFSAYYGDRLGASTDRVWNGCDVVPRAWDPELLAQVPTLYQSVGLHNELFNIALRATLPAIRHFGYVHVLPDAPYLEGSAPVGAKSWAEEVLYQHVAAYPALIGITMPKDEPPSIASSPPAPRA